MDSNTVDSDVVDEFILDTSAWIDDCLGGKYAIPLRSDDLTGTISVNSGVASITGTSTVFNSELRQYRHYHIIVEDTRELLVVDNYTSDTTLTLKYAPVLNATDSNFYFLPRSINTIVKYETARKVLQFHFSEEAYNQSTEAFQKIYETTVGSMMECLKDGSFYNTDLVEVPAGQSPARMIKVVQPRSTLANEVYDDYSLITNAGLDIG